MTYFDNDFNADNLFIQQDALEEDTYGLIHAGGGEYSMIAGDQCQFELTTTDFAHYEIHVHGELHRSGDDFSEDTVKDFKSWGMDNHYEYEADHLV